MSYLPRMTGSSSGLFDDPDPNIAEVRSIGKSEFEDGSRPLPLLLSQMFSFNAHLSSSTELSCVSPVGSSSSMPHARTRNTTCYSHC